MKAKKAYFPPTLQKQQRLAEVTAGFTHSVGRLT
jgi:hypothetical protein